MGLSQQFWLVKRGATRIGWVRAETHNAAWHLGVALAEHKDPFLGVVTVEMMDASEATDPKTWQADTSVYEAKTLNGED